MNELANSEAINQTTQIGCISGWLTFGHMTGKSVRKTDT